MLDGVLVCDVSGRAVLTNRAGARIFGLDRPEELMRVLNESPELFAFRGPDGAPVSRDAMGLARALDGETVVEKEYLVYNRQLGRDLHVRESAAPLLDARGRISGAVAVIRDVTAFAELDQLKDQFISVAAHELKTPVAVMKGFAQTLLRTAQDLSPPRRRMLEAIDRGADRIDNTVRELLDVSQLHLGRLELAAERVDLLQLVEEVVDRLAVAATRHRIRVVAAEPAVVQGDHDRLAHVLGDLIDNAVRYSPEGGDVDVEMRVTGRKAIVSVRDQGVGIPREKQRHIFERFYRAHTGTPFDYGGMGVGLYVAWEIIHRHGGRIWFESEEGRGSTFHFSLPDVSTPRRHARF
jgi:two-component system, OmpR family, sensor histidine kinase VicK